MQVVRLAPAGGPFLQAVLASLPLFALLVYFLIIASKRSSHACYQVGEGATFEEAEPLCSKLVDLSDMVFIFLAIALLFSLLAVYMSLFVRRRQALVERYLTEGLTVLGEVEYEEKEVSVCRPLRNHGHVYYANPNYENVAIYIHRQVRLFQLYSRERVTLLYLPGEPFSAQPKEDLEVDRAVFSRNANKFKALTFFAWCWVVFALLAPIYIIIVINRLPYTNLAQPDPNPTRTTVIYNIAAVLIIPIIAIGVNWIAWYRHEKWMTKEHQIVQGDDLSSMGQFSGSHDSEAQYEPPKTRRHRK